MTDYDALSREELIGLLSALYQKLDLLTEENRVLREELGGKPPPPAASPPSVPAWVKANKTPKLKVPRKPRSNSFARQREEPAQIVEHACERCPDCNRKLLGGSVHHTRQVVDIPEAKVDVVEHHYLVRWCGACKKRVRPKVELANQTVGQHRLGINLMSQVAYLHTVGRMTLRQMQEWLQHTHGLHVAIGELTLILQKVAEMGKGIYGAFMTKIREHSFVHADETGWREDGINGYIWSLSIPGTTIFHRDPSRASSVIQGLLGETFEGILVSDFYCGYRWYNGKHQWCWVHYLRDLRELAKKHSTDAVLLAWIARIKKLYKEAKAFSHPNAYKRERARLVYERRLLTLATPWLGADRPQRVLAERARDFLKGMFTFVEHPEVPSENNAAERSVRPCVISRKVSGGTRSEKGSETRSILFSLFATWRLRNHDPIECCRQLLSGQILPTGDPSK